MKLKLQFSTLLFFLLLSQITSAQLKILGKGIIGGSVLPSDAFQVNGDMQLEESSPFLRFKTTTGVNAGFNWKNASNANIAAFFFDPESGNFYLDINGFSVNGSESEFTFDADGEMGIGTNNPLAPLHIRGNGASLARFESGGNYWEMYTVDGTGNFELFQNGVFKGRFLESDGSYTPTSDKRYKSNIRSMETVLDRIQQLQPKTYTMKHSKRGNEHIGFLAQEVEKIFPQMVYLGPVGGTSEEAYTMNYNSMAVVAIKGIQELITKDELLEQEQEELNTALKLAKEENLALKETLTAVVKDVEDLKALLEQVAIKQEACCTVQEVELIELEAEQQIVAMDLNSSLGQNRPNPFQKETIIDYTLPEKFTEAYLQIVDINGRAIKRIDLEGVGNGQVNIDAKNLTSGQYVYSLFVDGELVETRKMLLVKD